MTHPIAVASDWKTLPLPAQHTTLALDFTLDAAQAAALRKGFIPRQMEDKWFFYCIGDTLYQHRSWTGNCMALVHFTAHGDGLRATHAQVNRDPAQYANTDDQVDVELIERLVRDLADFHLGDAGRHS